MTLIKIEAHQRRTRPR